MNTRKKIIRTSTIPASMKTFCSGLFRELQEEEGYEIVVVSSPGKALEDLAESDGVRIAAVAMERHFAPLSDIKSLWKLIRVFRRERPEMVHSMTPKAGLLSMLAARITRVPVRVHTFTGLVFPTASGMTRRILMLTDRLTCACATHIIPEGVGVKTDLINHGITRKPLRVLGHGNIRGIDLRRYDPEEVSVKKQAAVLRRPDLTTFIFVGRLVGDKGINELVEAFQRIHRDYPDTRLILVGPEEAELDPLKPTTRQVISDNEAIVAVGQKKDVRPWLAASDILVFPSYREGFPNVVIEAGAMGLPSIVTDINGSREIIIEGENGTIVAPHDTGALEETMRRFLKHPEITASMAAKARGLIASRYEQSYVRQCLKDFYKMVLT